MTIVTRILTALISMLLVLAPAAAHADDTLPVDPGFAFPLTNADGTPATVVRVQAGRLTWHMKQIARWWDKATPGLSIEVGPCVPGVHCVRIEPGTWNEAQMSSLAQRADFQWWGLMLYPTDMDRTILLNRTAPNDVRRHVASHELAHALGLTHHDGPEGLMCVPPASCNQLDSWTPEWTPSPAELALVNAYYLPGV